MSPKAKKEPVEAWEVIDIRRHHGDVDLITAAPVEIVARRGPLGRSPQLKFMTDKFALEIGDHVGLQKL